MSYYGTVEERVARGAEWLDEHGPAEWWERVSYGHLDIDSGFDCILGQVFNAEANEHGMSSGYLYVTTSQDYGVGFSGRTANVQQYGFCATGESDDDAYTLRDEWIDCIENRKALVSA